jgi:hypothetical protein
MIVELEDKEMNNTHINSLSKEMKNTHTKILFASKIDYIYFSHTRL